MKVLSALYFRGVGAKWPQITESRNPHLRTFFPTGTVCSFIPACTSGAHPRDRPKQASCLHLALSSPSSSQRGQSGRAAGQQSHRAQLLGLGRRKGRKRKVWGLQGYCRAGPRCSSLPGNFLDKQRHRATQNSTLSFTTQHSNPLFVNDAI